MLKRGSILSIDIQYVQVGFVREQGGIVSSRVLIGYRGRATHGSGRETLRRQ